MRGSTVCNQIAHLSGLFAWEECSSVEDCSVLRITDNDGLHLLLLCCSFLLVFAIAIAIAFTCLLLRACKLCFYMIIN